MKKITVIISLHILVQCLGYSQDVKFQVFCKSEKDNHNGKGATLEPLEIISVDRQGETQIVKLSFDTRHQAFRQLKAKAIERDSFSGFMQMYLIDTANLYKWQVENDLFILLKKRPDGSCVIIPDLNHNGKFSDDPIYNSNNLSKDEIVIPYSMPFWYQQRYVRNFDVVLLPNPSHVPKKYPNAVFNTWGGAKKINKGYIQLGRDSFLVNVFLPGKSIYYTKYNTKFSFGLANENSIDIYQTNYPVYSFLDSLYVGDKILMLDTISILGDTAIFKQVGENLAFKGVQQGATLKSIAGTNFTSGIVEDIYFKRTDGKYSLLHFWGSWCGPCITNLPLLKNFADKNSDKLETIGFPFEQQQDTVKSKKLIRQYGLTWKQIIQLRDHPFQKPDVVKQLRIEHFPTYMLIDSSGKILVRTSKLEEITEVLQ